MSKSDSGEGASSLFMLFIVFLVLKLTNTIHWSWWWVSSPLWAGIAFVIAVVVLYVVSTVVVGAAVGLYRLIFWSRRKRREAKQLKKVADAMDSYAASLSRFRR